MRASAIRFSELARVRRPRGQQYSMPLPGPFGVGSYSRTDHDFRSDSSSAKRSRSLRLVRLRVFASTCFTMMAQ